MDKAFNLIQQTLIVVGIFFATLQLTHLLPVNPDYQASWLKFASGAAGSIFGYTCLKINNKPNG